MANAGNACKFSCVLVAQSLQFLSGYLCPWGESCRYGPGMCWFKHGDSAEKEELHQCKQQLIELRGICQTMEETIGEKEALIRRLEEEQKEAAQKKDAFIRHLEAELGRLSEEKRELPGTEPGGSSGGEAQWEAGQQQEREPVQLGRNYYEILATDEAPLAREQKEALQQDEIPEQQSGASKQKEGKQERTPVQQVGASEQKGGSKKEQTLRGRRQRGSKSGSTTNGGRERAQVKNSGEAKEVGGENREDEDGQPRKSSEAKEAETVAMADGEVEHCSSEAGCSVGAATEMGKVVTEDGQAQRCGEEGSQEKGTAPAPEGGQQRAVAGPGETGEEGGGFELHGHEQELHGRWLMARDKARSRDVRVLCEEDMPLLREVHAFLNEVRSKNRGREKWLRDLFLQQGFPEWFFHSLL
mmetsp:Transcript_26315/g.45945  ORF Transcript_26315/g.45945 Transcript_26315/m.45945 type:complete len:414 (+) Transcript_26315:140-1381(+)